MAFSVTLPELGESVTEGTVTRWLKQEGDSVAVDEPLLEISTDKVDTEVPSPVAGVVQRIVAKEDDTVEVGGELAVIDDGSGGDSGSAAPAGQAAEAPAQEAPAQQAPAQQAPAQEAPTQQGHAEAAPVSEAAEQPDAQGQAAGTSVRGATETPDSGQAEQEAPAQPSEGEAGGSAAGGGTAVTLPELGESVTEGTVTRWLKQVGDTVTVDEPLLEISTDKVDTEVPSPVTGTVLEISAAEDETVPVGGQLAVIGTPGGGAAAPAPASGTVAAGEPRQTTAAPPAPAQEAPAQQAPAQEAPAQEAEPAPRHAAPDGEPQAENGDMKTAPYVTPLVRKLAAEHDIDLSTVNGSGVGGRIRKQDVMAAVEAQEAKQAPAAPAATEAPAAAAPAAAAPAQPGAAPVLDKTTLRGTSQKANRIRLTIAKRTKESLQTSAQLTQVHEVDVTKIARLRQQAKKSFQEREGVKLTFLPFFAKATVEALKQHPNINAYLDEEAKEITYFGEEHLAIAVDTDRGLISPVLHNAGSLNLAGLAAGIADIAERTRTNKIKPDELSGGTFTITNLGSNGALFDTPIINQPQSGILGVGAVVKKPVVITDADGNDTIAIRSTAYLALTYDHRLIDGADAGRFLTTIKQRLQEGSFESELGL